MSEVVIERRRKRPARATLYCSFCGKADHEVVALINGPTVFICDECSDLVAEIVAEKRRAASELYYGMPTDERARLIIFGSGG